MRKKAHTTISVCMRQRVKKYIAIVQINQSSIRSKRSTGTFGKVNML